MHAVGLGGLGGAARGLNLARCAEGAAAGHKTAYSTANTTLGAVCRPDVAAATCAAHGEAREGSAGSEVQGSPRPGTAARDRPRALHVQLRHSARQAVLQARGRGTPSAGLLCDECGSGSQRALGNNGKRRRRECVNCGLALPAPSKRARAGVASGRPTAAPPVSAQFRGVSKKTESRFEAQLHVPYSQLQDIPEESLPWRAKLKAQACEGQCRGYQVYLGVYTTAELAAQTYDRAALKFFGQLDAKTNFPLATYMSPHEVNQRNASTHAAYLTQLRSSGRRSTEQKRFGRGVYRRANGKFQARKSSVMTFGTFDDNEDAKVAYDLGILWLEGPGAELNYPLEMYWDTGRAALREDYVSLVPAAARERPMGSVQCSRKKRFRTPSAAESAGSGGGARARGSCGSGSASRGGSQDEAGISREGAPHERRARKEGGGGEGGCGAPEYSWDEEDWLEDVLKRWP